MGCHVVEETDEEIGGAEGEKKLLRVLYHLKRDFMKEGID